MSDLVFIDHNESGSRLENNNFLDANDHIVIPFCKWLQNVVLGTNLPETSKDPIV